MKTKVLLEATAGGIGLGLAYIFGGFDQLLVTFCVCVGLDYLTGILCAIFVGNVSSRAMAKGLIRKLGYFILIALAVQLDIVFRSEVLRIGTIGAFIGVEGLSIIENWGRIGLPLPKQLKNALEQFRCGAQSDDDKSLS